MGFNSPFKGLNPELNPICHLLALLGAHHILHVGRIRVKVQDLTKNLNFVISIFLSWLGKLVDT